MRQIEEWYLPADGDDIAPAWARMMGGGDGLSPIRAPRDGRDEAGDVVIFGAKDYIARSPLEVTRRVVVRGAGEGNTRVYCHDTAGFIIRARGSANSTRPGNGGAGTSVEDLTLIGRIFNASLVVPGVLCEASIRMHRVQVQDFTSHGIDVDADVNRGTNANGCRFDVVTSDRNGKAGFHFIGGDANVCVLTACGATNNDEHGYLDESFLGNFAYGCRASSNGAAAIIEHGDFVAMGDSQKGAWLGIYEETPGPGSLRRSRIEPPNRWEGRALLDGLNTRMGSAGIRMDGAGMLMSGVGFVRPEGRVMMTLAPPDIDAAYEIRDLADSNDWHRHVKRRSGGFAGSWVHAPKGGNAGAPLTLKSGEMRCPAVLRAAPAAVSGDLPPVRRVASMPAAGAYEGEAVEITDAQHAKVRRYEWLGGAWMPIEWTSVGE